MKSAHSLEILFEDKWLVVIGKPSGMLSVGYPGYRGKSAEDVLTDMNRSRGKIRVSAVHRLDRDTSGVMMFALSVEAKKRIMDEWQDIVSERVYRCVCCRDAGAAPLPDEGTVDAPLAYNRYDVAFVPKPNDHKTLKDAEKAVTHFRVLERGDRYDLVECELETGRKNQIRAHMAHLGHPVAGDEVYGADHSSGASEANDRLALHARVLAFTHPFTGDQHRFEIPEPDSFAKMVIGKKKRQAETAGGTATGSRAKDGPKEAPKVPRRQRGKPPREYQERSKKNDEFIDVKPAPKKSRTQQVSGKSRFIPGK